MTVTPFERWAVWLTTAGTLLTGLVYWWMKDLMTAADPWSVINHPLQPWMLKAHILIAPLLVFSVGLITSRHIWRHYRMGVGRGRRTGLVSALTFLVVVVSGYVLQVVTGESLLRILGWVHLGLGIVYSVGVAAHWPATRGRPDRAGRPERTGRIDRQLPPTGQRAPLGLEGGAVSGHERRRRSGTRRRADARDPGRPAARPGSATSGSGSRGSAPR